MEAPELNAIDRHFAALMRRIAPNPSCELEVAAGLVSRLRGEGHVCLPLTQLEPEKLAGMDTSVLPEPATWMEKLRQSGVVGAPAEFKPLILDDAGRLYLQRYWQYEAEVIEDVSNRLRETSAVQQTRLKQWFNDVFPHEPKLQKLAAFVAATSNLCLISGAPGTGKTHTIVMICALLLGLDRHARIALAAPTGKAAARLKEALTRARMDVKLPADIAVRIPAEASTIQRLLGVIGHSEKFRHNREHQLVADAVIVDEASMIDLALLAKLLRAIKPKARVILVGDKDQLASVEAGSAFRDMCMPDQPLGISESQAKAFEKCTGEKIDSPVTAQAPIHNAVVELMENFRFQAGSDLGELSAAVNQGDAVKTKGILNSGRVKWRRTPPLKILESELRKTVLPRFTRLLTTREPKEALARLSEFVVLCALRRGPFGAATINDFIQRILFDAGDISGSGRYFPGQPLMIVRNDYDLGLFNGDIGVVFPHDGGWRVFFPGEDGQPRSYTMARLPEHEPAFAITVHKSQGSEFQDVLVLFPEQDAPVLTRELLYTALTRARGGAELWANEQILANTIGRKVRRGSGLRDRLWSGA